MTVHWLINICIVYWFDWKMIIFDCDYANEIFLIFHRALQNFLTVILMLSRWFHLCWQYSCVEIFLAASLFFCFGQWRTKLAYIPCIHLIPVFVDKSALWKKGKGWLMIWLIIANFASVVNNIDIKICLDWTDSLSG